MTGELLAAWGAVVLVLVIQWIHVEHRLTRIEVLLDVVLDALEIPHTTPNPSLKDRMARQMGLGGPRKP